MNLEELKQKAMTGQQIQDWVYTPSERRTDPLGGAYDTELTENRKKVLWVMFDDVLQIVSVKKKAKTNE